MRQAKLRLVKNLLEKRSVRRKEGLFVIEGPHLVEAAVKSGVVVEFVVGTQAVEGVECIKVSKKEFSEISDVETPQGILAVVRIRECSLEEIRGGIVVFCHEIQDPGNLGTIIRTADAVGAAGVIISKGTVDLYNSKTIRSTMGSLFHLPIVEVEAVAETFAWLKKKGMKTVATSLFANKNYFEVDYRGNVMVVVGNEGAGLPEEIVKLCDETVKIPMPGKAESLNVSISTAIILYEALRQRFAFSA